MKENLLRYTLRINKEIFKKFKYIAEFEGRSANRSIEQLIKKQIDTFEKEHGKINQQDLDEMN